MKPWLVDVCLFIGGFAGPFVRSYLGPGATITRATVAQGVLLGAAMVVATALGFIPESVKLEAITESPIKTIAVALLGSALAGAAILYTATAAIKKFLPGAPPNNNNGGTAAKR